uniref:Cytochrome c assembly protein domain-containing protein n=1 Tax=Quercus lobata TaxID=97700 RepID=A0A7N2N716_QUELO
MGAFFTLFTLVTGGFRGRPMWGTFWVWDARLTSVFISFLIYLGALRFQKLPVEPASISIRAGPIDIPIIKSSINWWNTLHQPGSISRSSTSIHVPMLIPILSNFANFPFSTRDASQHGMLFLLPLGSGMEELVQHQPRDSFPDYKKRKPCLLLIWFGILRSNFPVGSIQFHPIPSILRLITRNRILSH